jgi:hypothetical protein
MDLRVGLAAGLITFGVLAGVLWSQGFFGGGSGGGGGGGAQIWKVYSSTTFPGQVLTITVNGSGNFVSATGWTTAAGIGYYPITITNGSMSYLTTMSFNVSATYESGSLTGTYTGTLDVAFPNATSASGTASGTISDGAGTRALSDTWTATKTA